MMYFVNSLIQKIMASRKIENGYGFMDIMVLCQTGLRGQLAKPALRSWLRGIIGSFILVEMTMLIAVIIAL